MKKTMAKFLSLAFALILTLSTTTTAFAAESKATPDNSSYTIVEQEVPVVSENGRSGIAPLSQNDSITFKVGSVGYISNCGFTPKFKCWVTGGSADTQVKFTIKTGGGITYGPFGPLKADGSNYLDKPFIVYNGSGVWQFTATVTSGNNNGNLVCHVVQYY